MTSSFYHSITTPERSRKTSKYDCPNVFWKGAEYFVIHELILVAINSFVAFSVNYFKGRQVIPLKVAILSAGTTRGYII